MPLSLERSLSLAAAATCLVLSSTGCAAHRFEQNRPGAVQRGVASWYGADFHGRRTASGSVYDMHDMTAAHRELPLGSQVEVRNLENGKSVRVEITDRRSLQKGPHRRHVLCRGQGARHDAKGHRAGRAADPRARPRPLGTQYRHPLHGAGGRFPRPEQRGEPAAGAGRPARRRAAGRTTANGIGCGSASSGSLDDAEAVRGELLGLGYHAVVVYLN